MITLDYYELNRDRRVVVGLGYFDSVHKGHCHLIDEVKRLASELDAVPAVFTFVNNPFSAIGKDTKSIFTFSERVRRLENVGVEMVIGADVGKDFFDMSGDEFLDILTGNYDIVGIVSGTDYTYGKYALSGTEELKKHISGLNIRYSIVNLVEECGRKIASRDIRDLLTSGDIAGANRLLSEPYTMSGRVRSGRRDGAKIGFPTANIDIEKDLLIIKEGVYSSIVIVDGVRYRAVTNVGGHPTFGDDRENIEPYIIDFDDDIYGKDIVIVPCRWLRGVKKFDTVRELQDTIARDEVTTRNEVIL